MPGEALGIRNQADVAKGFVVDAFMANWDLVVEGKNLWLSGGKIYRMDNGGALRYRAMGAFKTLTGYDFSSALSDLYTLRGQRYPLDPTLDINTYGQQFYGTLTQPEILRQIEKLVALKDVILKTADKYNQLLGSIKDYPKLISNLVTRLNSLKSYHYDQAIPVNQYRQAHPFAVVIPNKSSASILIVTEHNGRKKVLLGKRVRHDWWGNFGGKADDEDKTLLNAAVREVSEESMGLYHVLTDDLVQAPFHDLIKGGDLPDALHRMYLLEGRDYIDPSIFKTALRGQTDEHSQEYTDFAWVDVADLLALVKTFQSTPNQTDNENQYVLKDDKRRDISIHHPLMDMLRQAPVVAWLEALTSNVKVKPSHTQGSIGSTVLKDPRRPSWYPSPPFFDPRAEEGEKLYNLMTKHLDLMTQVKQKGEKIREILKPIEPSTTSARASSSSASSMTFKEEEAQGSAGSSTSAGDLSRTETATDTHLKWSLEQAGIKYTQGNDQKNIYLFLKDVSTISKGYCEEFNPASGTCAPGTISYKCMLLEAVAEERNMKNWFVFYHTLPGKMAFIYDIATEFRNALRVMGSSNDARVNMHSLRVLDTFFKDLANVDAFIEDQMKKQNTENFREIDNYESNFQENGLSVNIYLFGSKDCNYESTFGMLHSNYTITPPDYTKFLSHLISQFSLTNTDKYFELFKRYFGETDTNQLLQIFVNPDVVNNMVYLSALFGRGLYETPLEQKQKLAPRAFLETLRQDPIKAANALISIPSSLGFQTLQARIFSKPDMMADSGKVQIKRYFRVNPKEGYLRELRAMVREDLTQWLQAKHELSPDTLENPSSSDTTRPLTSLQKVHRHMHQSSGITYETKTTVSKYGQFLKTDNLDGIKQILAQDRNFDLFKPIANVDYMDDSIGLPDIIPPIALFDDAPKVLEWMIQNHSERLKNAALEAIKSTDEYVKTSALKLFLDLVNKNQGFLEALAAASEAIKSTDNKDKRMGFSLFLALVNKNQGVTEAIAAASEAIKSTYYMTNHAARGLLEALKQRMRVDTTDTKLLKS
ncbi:NUDIX hydrolase [Candidatus Finniella inopinata]|uniref:NUDIX hydrolase n=1 Tax=Candidatus Finniella inopinata TaxID=1696036 RepID=A0A4Q7DIE5_9PROT|nr:NUDIX hydrolase [Candidatus Finniella inopinata]RZI45959.1 NUDIX hydrolase [Candidatus Finniella inopinata]